MTKTEVSVTQQIPKASFSIGQYFLLGGTIVLLSQVEPWQVTLIEADAGNRYTEPVKIKDPLAVPLEILEELSAGRPLSPITSLSITYSL